MEAIKKNSIWKLHVVFWILFFLMSITLTSRMMMDFKVAFAASTTNIVTLIPIVYTILYYLLPKYWDTKKFLNFWIAAIAFLITAAFIRTAMAHGLVRLFGGDEVKLGNDGFFFQFLLGSTFTSLLILPLKWVGVMFDKIEYENQLKTQKLESELLFLRTQVNPHFLFNALNNIYSLSYTKSDKAPELILKLSDMMSYMLYDISDEKVSLQNELNYLKNYIDLEKVKTNNPLNVQFQESGDIHLCRIEPMLFISIIENTFKHGNIQESNDGWIDIVLKVEDSKIIFKASNSYTAPALKAKKGGVGLTNLKRRLALLYPETHVLEISDKNGVFEVVLELSCEANLIK